MRMERQFEAAERQFEVHHLCMTHDSTIVDMQSVEKRVAVVNLLVIIEVEVLVLGTSTWKGTREIHRYRQRKIGR